MLKIKGSVTAIAIIFILHYSVAQTSNFGTWSSIGIEKKISKKWDVASETELRTIGGNNVYFVRLIERWNIGLTTSYDINKNLNVGVGYDFMNKLDTKYKNYQFRNRYHVTVTGKLKAQAFSFTLRQRMQMIHKDDSKRIMDDGNIDTYDVNPEWTWRNRLKISYNIPNFKINPSLSAETFFQLNQPDGNSFENIRYILSFDYKYKRHHLFEFYGVYNSELISEDSYGRYVLGVSYKYSF